MKTINFDCSGAPLSVNVFYEGLLVAGYVLKLSERNSSKTVIQVDGDNINPLDDFYELPTPAGTNEGRILRLISQFVSADTSSGGDYLIALHVFQGDEFLGEETETGQLTGSGQTSILFVKLEC